MEHKKMIQQQQVFSLQWFSEVASWKRFSQLSQVRSGVVNYINNLKTTSLLTGSEGKSAEDQDYPIEVLSFQPPTASDCPILLIGGMGPLAGAVGFDLACEYFGTRREIVLYQACSIPSRMTVMLEPNRMINGLPIQKYLVKQVSNAIVQAKQYLQSKQTNIIIVLMCNAVHYYLPLVKADLQKRYPKVASELQYISLVSAVMTEMKKRKLNKPLLLGTSATKLDRLYSGPLEKRGIKFQELSEGEQEILMSAIYWGVKAFDKEYACRKGEELLNLLKEKFNSTIQTEIGDIDCVIAGCTEVPILLDWLKEKSQINAVQSWLTQVKVINPLRSACKWIRDQNQEEAFLIRAS